MTALEVVSKQYNNVKWKGCKLRVQAAKPHFLERLQEERHEREERQSLGSMLENCAPNTILMDETATKKLPRRLRIRRKFGEEAFHVDTRPWEVDSWYHFEQAQHKLAKKRQRHEQKEDEKSNSQRPSGDLRSRTMHHKKAKLPWRHRTIHIRFPEDASIEEGDNEKNKVDRKLIEKDREELPPPQSPSVTVSSDNSDSTSSEQSSSDDDKSPTDSSHKQKPMQSSAYVWSDDSSEAEEKQVGAQSDQLMEKSALHASKSESRPTTSPENDQDDSSSTKFSNPDQSGTHKDKGYTWSSNESSSDDEDDENILSNEKSTRPFQLVPQTQEFDAGIDQLSSSDAEDDDESNNDEGTTEDSVDESNSNGGASTVDVTTDVSANLNILASLFPEVGQSEPAAFVDKRDIQETATTSGPLMVRYDPTAATSQQYEVDDEPESATEKFAADGEAELETENNVDDGGDQKVTSDEVSVEQNEGVENADEASQENGKEGTPKSEGIYEQDKLENVFRDVRESWNNNREKDAEVNQSSKATGFSFGFDLKPPAKEKDETCATSGFSFGFDIPGDGANDNSNDRKGEDTVPAVASIQSEEPKPEIQATERRRRGIGVDTKTLELFVADFYAINNGSAIMADPDGFRKDPNEREQWLKERQVLTLDWKRKKKYAETRNQKRQKLR